MKYSEKLRDPRWQRKRLEIMQRDNFTCLACGDTEKTQNVHHKKYHGSPWEAPSESLETLCEPCHEKRTKLNAEFLNLSSYEAFARFNVRVESKSRNAERIRENWGAALKYARQFCPEIPSYDSGRIYINEIIEGPNCVPTVVVYSEVESKYDMGKAINAAIVHFTGIDAWVEMEKVIF